MALRCLRCKAGSEWIAGVGAASTTTEDDAFHAGTLAALDVVYLHDQPVIAEEIVNASDPKAILAHARREQYHNMKKLRLTIRRVNRRSSTSNKKSSISNRSQEKS